MTKKLDARATHAGLALPKMITTNAPWVLFVESEIPIDHQDNVRCVYAILLEQVIGV
jgi:hypothetical protein